MNRKSLGHLRFREMFLSITGGADGSFNVLQQGSQDRVTSATVGVREGTSDLWGLVAGFRTVRLETYPQDAMGVPSLPSTHATLASAIGSPQDCVWDGTWYWVLDNPVTVEVATPLQSLADVVQESLRRLQVQGVPLEPRRAADTAYALVRTEVSAAIDSLLDTREAVIKEYLRIAEALEKETHPEMTQSYADSLSELADMLAGLNEVIEAGSSAVGLFRMSLEALLGDMLYLGSRQFVLRKRV